MEIEIASPFKSVLELEKRFVLIKGGRDSGKSRFAAQLLIILSMGYANRDIIVARDAFADLRDSSFTAIIKLSQKYKVEHLFEVSKSPIRIRNRLTNTNIYFIGIGGSDIHRTKSFEPLNEKLIAVMFEELQQVKDQESYEQAIASFRRFIDVDKGVFIHLFNPEPQNAHWVNILYNLKTQDPDWLCIHTTYLDIIQYLNDIDLKEIIKVKITDESRYNWLYLGETGGGFGSVYPQFKRDKHYIKLEEARRKFQGIRIHGLIIGVDGAVTHDATVATPIALFENGQAAVLDIFYHDPQKSGPMASSEIVPLIKKWLAELRQKYKLDDFNTPILFKVDSAAPDLTRQLAYALSDRAQVASYKKPTILEMVGVVQSTLSQNVVYIIDYDGYQDYTLNKWVKGDNPLAVQLENLIWNEKQTGYDDTIPNDATDAFTYGINTYFKNPDNIHWLQNIKRKDFYDLEVKGGL
jgi:PBSX family phage terminase large subunit